MTDTWDLANVPIVSLATLPARSRHRFWGFGGTAVIVVAFCLVAPFTTIRLREALGFIPAIQGTVVVTDLTTAVWLLAQVSLTRSRALLVLANAYLFTSLIALAHTLTFPGEFAPIAPLGTSLQTNGWLYTIWHFSFPAAVIVYVFLKSDERAENRNILKSTRTAIYASVVSVSVLACAIVWGLTVGDQFLPTLFLDRVTYAPFVFYNGGFNALICGIAFLYLASRKTSVLDELLLISVAATLAEMVMVAFFSKLRYDVGWYTVRAYGVVAANAVFMALFTEFTRVYSQISVALRTVKAERDSKLLGAQTATAALAHELQQPLSAIVLHADAGLLSLEQTPPDLNEVRQSLSVTMSEAHHLSETIQGIRRLFREIEPSALTPIDLNAIIVMVLRTQQRDLARRNVEIRQELLDDLPHVRGHETQIEEVIGNLVRNAADAMEAITGRNRVLTVKTRLHGRDAVAVEIADNGPGFDPARSNEIFDAFVTTKSQGLGLGLAICRRIIEHHGGELTASSDGQSGATFQFVLPTISSVRGSPTASG